MKNIIIISGVILILILNQSCTKEVDNTIRDIDGNVYTSVTIGTQTWMVENLKTTKYRNGDLIGTTIPATLDISAEALPKYQWAYEGNESNVATYGRLYTWYAITDNRNVCPTNWHVPSDDEWNTLTTYLGGGTTAGGKLKETGTTHWKTPNAGATNDSGFTGLPGGFRNTYSSFLDVGYFGYWWSSTENSAVYAWFRYLDYEYADVSRYGTYKSHGLSIRCLKDN